LFQKRQKIKDTSSANPRVHWGGGVEDKKKKPKGDEKEGGWKENPHKNDGEGTKSCFSR